MRVSQVLAGCCFVALTSFVAADAFAQSETGPPSGNIGFAVAELAEGKVKLDFGKNGTPKPVIKNVEQTYTVAVPYTEKIMKDGREINVTKTRMETRTRTVQVTVMEAKQFQTFAIEELKFFKSNGDEIETGDAKVRMETKQPIVILPAGQKLSEFYMAVLRDDVIVASLPEKE